jgi:hypothetical protein
MTSACRWSKRRRAGQPALALLPAPQNGLLRCRLEADTGRRGSTQRLCSARLCSSHSGRFLYQRDTTWTARLDRLLRDSREAGMRTYPPRVICRTGPGGSCANRYWVRNPNAACVVEAVRKSVSSFHRHEVERWNASICARSAACAIRPETKPRRACPFSGVREPSMLRMSDGCTGSMFGWPNRTLYGTGPLVRRELWASCCTSPPAACHPVHITVCGHRLPINAYISGVSQATARCSEVKVST